MELFYFQVDGDAIFSQRGDLSLLEKQGCWVVLGVVADNATKIPLSGAAPGPDLGQAFFQGEGAPGGRQRL